jgi:hypothetical protein
MLSEKETPGEIRAKVLINSQSSVQFSSGSGHKSFAINKP